jgi:hypothetical protein
VASRSPSELGGPRQCDAIASYHERRDPMIRRWMCALVVVSFHATAGYAQDNAPKNFYKKDYAVAPGAEGRDEPQPTKEAAANKVRGTPTKETPAQGTQHKATPAPKKRRIVVSVYVSSADKDHLTKVLEEVLAVHDERTALVTSVNHIGDYRNVSPEMESELAKRQIKLLAAAEPPSSARVSVSPAWIIQTKQGTHIAEGTVAIHSFFDEFGEYNLKASNDQNPKTSVEGF